MLSLDNVILPTEVDKNGIKVVADIDADLAPLVEALALTHPEWRFESHYCRKYYGGNTGEADFKMVVERVKVMDKYEELGLLGTDYTRSGKRFWVSNHRVEKMRERGSGMKTIHLNKALKYVEKYFSAKNLSEKVDEAELLARRAVQQSARDKWYVMNNTWRNLEHSAIGFVASKLDEFRQWVEPRHQKDLDGLLEKIDEANAMRKMEVGYSDCTLVIIDGMNYIVKSKDADGMHHNVEVKASEELPDEVRRGLGMLKLVEEGQAIANIGVRVNANTYVVMTNNVREGEV